MEREVEEQTTTEIETSESERTIVINAEEMTIEEMVITTSDSATQTRSWRQWIREVVIRWVTFILSNPEFVVIAVGSIASVF